MGLHRDFQVNINSYVRETRMLGCQQKRPLMRARAHMKSTVQEMITVMSEYSEPDSKHSKTDQCRNESASDPRESGSNVEPESEPEPESTTVLTSSAE